MRPVRRWVIKNFPDGSIGVCLEVLDGIPCESSDDGTLFLRNAVRCRAIHTRLTAVKACVREATEFLPGYAVAEEVLEGREYEIFVPRRWSRPQQIAVAQQLLRHWLRRLSAALVTTRDRPARWDPPRRAVASLLQAGTDRRAPERRA